MKNHFRRHANELTNQQTRRTAIPPDGGNNLSIAVTLTDVYGRGRLDISRLIYWSFCLL